VCSRQTVRPRQTVRKMSTDQGVEANETSSSPQQPTSKAPRANLLSSALSSAANEPSSWSHTPVLSQGPLLEPTSQAPLLSAPLVTTYLLDRSKVTMLVCSLQNCLDNKQPPSVELSEDASEGAAHLRCLPLVTSLRTRQLSRQQM
jgi:hypothetical protein